VRDGDTVPFRWRQVRVMLEDPSEYAPEAAVRTEAVGERILVVRNQPYHLATHEFYGTASIF